MISSLEFIKYVIPTIHKNIRFKYLHIKNKKDLNRQINNRDFIYSHTHCSKKPLTSTLETLRRGNYKVRMTDSRSVCRTWDEKYDKIVYTDIPKLLRRCKRERLDYLRALSYVVSFT